MDDPTPRRRTPARAAAPMVRFATTGMAASGVYTLVVVTVGIARAVPVLVAHLLGTLVSTVVASTLHRRFTFRAAATTSWQRGQATGAVTAATGLALSSLVLAAWNSSVPQASTLTDVVVVQGTNAVVGLLSFAIMRRALATSPGPAPVPQPSPARVDEPCATARAA